LDGVVKKTYAFVASGFAKATKLSVQTVRLVHLEVFDGQPHIKNSLPFVRKDSPLFCWRDVTSQNKARRRIRGSTPVYIRH